jgi:hypothetical protein
MQVHSTIGQQVREGFESAVPQPSKRLALFVIAGLSAVFLVSVLFKPPTGEYFTVCGFKNFTGLPCPGCGLTHSFCALGKGDVTDAFTFNLLGPPLFLVFVLVWIRSACVLLSENRVIQLFDRITGRFNLVRAFAIAFGVYGIARIAYALAYYPPGFHESPLSRLLARLIH